MDEKKMDENLCGWCKEKMNPEAVKCPKCQKWRKDIYSERIKCYTLFTFSAIFLTIAVINGFESQLFSEPTFSFGKFFSSIFFWISIMLDIPAFVYYSKISKKIGTWWWA